MPDLIPIVLTLWFAPQTPATAPAPPNFAGLWVFENAVGPPPPPGVFGSPRRNEWGDEVSIQQSSSDLIVSYDRNGLRTSLTFKLDGSLSKNTVSAAGGNIEQTATAKWSGDKLVIVLSSGDLVQTRTIAYDGPKLKVTTSGGRRPDSVVLYRRR